MRILAHAFSITGWGGKRTDSGEPGTNEDTVSAFGWSTSSNVARAVDISALTDTPELVLVAEGMGGHAAGDRASKLAADSLQSIVHQMTTDDGIATALLQADSRIRSVARSEPDLTGMGTTVAGMVMHGTRGIAFNVGDSRIYRVSSEGLLHQISVDDSPYPATGESESRITQALGALGSDRAVFNAHTRAIDLSPDDLLLICSDGLSDFVSPAQLELTIKKHGGMRLVAKLYGMALNGGTNDNVSIVAIRFVDVSLPSPEPQPAVASGAKSDPDDKHAEPTERAVATEQTVAQPKRRLLRRRDQPPREEPQRSPRTMLSEYLVGPTHSGVIGLEQILGTPSHHSMMPP